MHTRWPVPTRLSALLYLTVACAPMGCHTKGSSPIQPETAEAMAKVAPPPNGDWGPDSFTQLAAGNRFTCALSAGHHVYCWGGNADGMFGEDLPRFLDVPTRVTAFEGADSIAVGGNALCLLRSLELWCSGAEGIGFHFVVKFKDARALAIGSAHACVLDGSDDLMCGLGGFERDPMLPSGNWPYASVAAFLAGPRPNLPKNDPWLVENVWPVIHGVREVRSFGGGTFCTLSLLGRVECLQEGSGKTISSSSSASDFFVYDGHLCGHFAAAPWSCDAPPGPAFADLSSALAEAGASSRVFTSGMHGFCTVRENGSATCFNPSPPIRDWAPAKLEVQDWPVASVSFGGPHACMLGRDGTARCWGSASDGMLGNGRVSSRARAAVIANLPPITQVVAQEADTCALDHDGAVWCWGRESDATPKRLALPNVVSEIGSLWPLCVRWKGSQGWSCRRGGYARGAWMAPNFGGAVPRRLWPDDGVLLHGISESGVVVSWAPPVSTSGFETSPVVFDATWSRGARAVSPDAACAIDEHADVVCLCGGGGLESRGLPDCAPGERAHVLESLHGASASILHSRNGDICATIAPEGRIACWRKEPAQLAAGARAPAKPDIAPAVDATALSALGRIEELVQSTDMIHGGSGHYGFGGFACARDEGGRVFCWGADVHEALGKEGVEQTSVPVQVTSLPKAKQLTLGGAHGCALGDDEKVYCWGDDSVGQLGDGFQPFARSPEKVAAPKW